MRLGIAMLLVCLSLAIVGCKVEEDFDEDTSSNNCDEMKWDQSNWD